MTGDSSSANVKASANLLGTCGNNIDKTLSVVTRQCAGLP
jgi:hypothetical protein